MQQQAGCSGVAVPPGAGLLARAQPVPGWQGSLSSALALALAAAGERVRGGATAAVMECEDGLVCGNCLVSVPSSNFDSHFNFCKRNRARCETCGEVMPRNALGAHFELHSSPAVAPPEEPLHHREVREPRHPEPEVQACPFCFLEHPATELPAHAEYCGSRTERCSSCFSFVQLRHLEQHKGSACTSLDGFPRLPASQVLPRTQHSPLYDGYDGYSSDASPPDQPMVSLGEDDRIAICPYCVEECVAVDGDTGGAAAALSRHLALTDCAEAFAIQQLAGPWTERHDGTQGAGRKGAAAERRATKRAMAAARKKQRELAAEYEAQAIKMYTPPSPPSFDGATLTGPGSDLEEAMRLQAERLAQLTMIDRDAHEQREKSQQGRDLQQSEGHDSEGPLEQHAQLRIDSPTITPATESGRGNAMVEFYSQRAEPDLAACYTLEDGGPHQDGSKSAGEGDNGDPQDSFYLDAESECQCQVCGRTVPISELDDHQMACQMSTDLAFTGELTVCDSQPLCPPPRPTIAVHRVQYDSTLHAANSSDAATRNDVDMHADTPVVRGRARKKKHKGTKGRRCKR